MSKKERQMALEKAIDQKRKAEEAVHFYQIIIEALQNENVDADTSKNVSCYCHGIFCPFYENSIEKHGTFSYCKECGWSSLSGYIVSKKEEK